MKSDKQVKWSAAYVWESFWAKFFIIYFLSTQAENHLIPCTFVFWCLRAGWSDHLKVN